MFSCRRDQWHSTRPQVADSPVTCQLAQPLLKWACCSEHKLSTSVSQKPLPATKKSLPPCIRGVSRLTNAKLSTQKRKETNISKSSLQLLLISGPAVAKSSTVCLSTTHRPPFSTSRLAFIPLEITSILVQLPRATIVRRRSHRLSSLRAFPDHLVAMRRNWAELKRFRHLFTRTRAGKRSKRCTTIG